MDSTTISHMEMFLWNNRSFRLKFEGMNYDFIPDEYDCDVYSIKITHSARITGATNEIVIKNAKFDPITPMNNNIRVDEFEPTMEIRQNWATFTVELDKAEFVELVPYESVAGTKYLTVRELESIEESE